MPPKFISGKWWPELCLKLVLQWGHVAQPEPEVPVLLSHWFWFSAVYIGLSGLYDTWKQPRDCFLWICGETMKVIWSVTNTKCLLKCLLQHLPNVLLWAHWPYSKACNPLKIFMQQNFAINLFVRQDCIIFTEKDHCVSHIVHIHKS